MNMNGILKLKKIEDAFMIIGSLDTAGHISLDGDTIPEVLSILYDVLYEDIKSNRLTRGMKFKLELLDKSYIVIDIEEGKFKSSLY